MTEDSTLLRRYADTGSEEAFAELVRLHVDLVYSVALRQVGGDAHLAQDVAQTVFTALARKAPELARREVIGGWLYRSTHFAASDAVRAERRRRAREQEALAMHEPAAAPKPEADLTNLRPLLDQAIGELGETDRDAICLRFFANLATPTSARVSASRKTPRACGSNVPSINSMPCLRAVASPRASPPSLFRCPARPPPSRLRGWARP